MKYYKIISQKGIHAESTVRLQLVLEIKICVSNLLLSQKGLNQHNIVAWKEIQPWKLCCGAKRLSPFGVFEVENVWKRVIDNLRFYDIGYKISLDILKIKYRRYVFALSNALQWINMWNKVKVYRNIVRIAYLVFI